MSRNKREGLYVGKLMGKHCRSVHCKGAKLLRVCISFGAYKLESAPVSVPNSYVVFAEMYLRGLPVW